MNFNKQIEYLVGVSGGADSMFLLEQLVRQKVEKIIICHVNYNYRNDSGDDQKIVEIYCKKNNLKLEILNLRPNYNSLGENFESWARTKRYEFFVEIAKKNNLKNLLVAHNQNDLVETYIMQKNRQNLVKWFGIKKISKYKDINVIRPMLNYKKSEIINWLEKNEVKYAIDKTNEDLKFERNLIRSQLQEKEFDKYLLEIDKANKILADELIDVEWYVNNNMSADDLIINKNLQNAELNFIQRCLYLWLEKNNKVFLVQHRSNKTLFEIAKNIKASKKNFWKVNIGNAVIFKDYKCLCILNKDMLNVKTVVIKKREDLYLVEEFTNWLELFNAIKKDNEKYPYVATNDYESYKLETFVGNKKTNRYFIDKKIAHKTRMLKAVVYKKSNHKILSNIK